MTDLKEGDSVLPIFTGECGECRHCKSEESNMCDLLRINTERGVMINDGKSRFSINGKPIYHFLGTSTFSKYTVVHVSCVAKINPEAPLNKVYILSCGVSTGKSLPGLFDTDLNYIMFYKVGNSILKVWFAGLLIKPSMIISLIGFLIQN